MQYGNIPASYDYLNAEVSRNSPSTVHCANTNLSAFFRRYLLQKAMSTFKWGMPETWSKNYFLYVLYSWGYLALVNTNKYGVIPQACGLSGYNVFYQPTNALITNPLLRGNLSPRIGKECVIIKLQPDYGGVMDLVGYYADMLALCAESAGINLINSHLAYTFFAENKAAAESFKKMYDKIASGDPCVVVDKSMLRDDGKPAWDMFSQDVGRNYIVGDVVSDMRKIEAQFDTDIGIPNANTDKRERLITDEVNANNVETFTKSAMWLEQLQESCKEARDMFGIELSVDWRFPPEAPQQERSADNEQSNN